MSQANDLTGLALRRRVAELRGFEDVYEMENGCLAGLLPDSEFSREVPAYESDIAAAWELVEAVKAMPASRAKTKFEMSMVRLVLMSDAEAATHICRQFIDLVTYIAAKEAQHV